MRNSRTWSARGWDRQVYIAQGIVAALAALFSLVAPLCGSLAQDTQPLAAACKPGIDKDCYRASAGKVFCTTSDGVEEQTGHGKNKAYLDSLGCMELQRSDVTMLKLYDDLGIWKVYILGEVMWTWPPLN
jgi:hypothetical protein